MMLRGYHPSLNEDLIAILGGVFKQFFKTIPGKMIQFDEHMFQMGWFNHQLVYLFPSKNSGTTIDGSEIPNNQLIWVFPKIMVPPNHPF